MKTQDLRQLAVLVAGENQVDNKVIDYIIKRLNISDLKLFKKYLDLEINKKKVFVETTDVSSELKSELGKIFPDRVLEIAENKSLGAGISIVDQDNHYDLSFRNKIEQIIEQLKN